MSPSAAFLKWCKQAEQPATAPGFRLYGWSEAQVKEMDYRVSPNGYKEENGR